MINARNILAGALMAVLGNYCAQANTYDVQHYDLSITPDFVAKTLTLSATIRIDNSELENAFSFELNRAYQNLSVSSPDSPVVTNRNGIFVNVLVERPTVKTTLLFNLKGALGRSLDEERDVVDRKSLFLLWSDRFYPITFRDWATVNTTITLPSEFQVIAPGRKIKAKPKGNETIHIFESKVPEVNFSVLADSRWTKTERGINGIRMQTLLHPESQKFAEQIFSTSSKVLKFYSGIFGLYPFEQFSFVTISGMYARRAFSDSVGYEPRWLEREFSTTGHDAHETSLLWWGHIIRGSGRGSSQWLEGFGDYAEVLYCERYKKPLPKNFQFFRDKYLASSPENDFLYHDLRGDTDQAFIHGKYPWLMHLVRFVVGDGNFRRALKLLFKKQRFRAISMEEFVSTLEEGSGKSLQWFREEWLNRKGFPSVSFKSEVRSQPDGNVITCELEQFGNVYHLPVEIGIETERDLRIERVYLNARQLAVSFRSKERPKRIVLDPNGWIIMAKVRS